MGTSYREVVEDNIFVRECLNNQIELVQWFVKTIGTEKVAKMVEEKNAEIMKKATAKAKQYRVRYKIADEVERIFKEEGIEIEYASVTEMKSRWQIEAYKVKK